MSHPNPSKPQFDPQTSSDAEFVAFVDPVGGLPLDDPEVRARQRRGRPREERKATSPGANDTPAPE